MSKEIPQVPEGRKDLAQAVLNKLGWMKRACFTWYVGEPKLLMRGLHRGCGRTLIEAVNSALSYDYSSFPLYQQGKILAICAGEPIKDEAEKLPSLGWPQLAKEKP